MSEISLKSIQILSSAFEWNLACTIFWLFQATDEEIAWIKKYFIEVTKCVLISSFPIWCET